MISQTGEDKLLRLFGAACRLGAWLAVLLLCQGTIADVEKMQSALKQLGGAPSVFRDWRQLIEDSRALGTQDKLRRINEFFNRKVQFADDMQIWGQTDYWATPLETLAKAKGDCEDFTIAKYFTLLEAGMTNDQLRLIYVKARIGGPASNVTQAHMVLAFYASPDAEPQILDNLITEIRPASRRSDLQPVFSFNSQGIWANPTASGVPSATGTGRLTRWQDLLNRVRAEGFEF
jgi:predicted transglutaminase-like cysteine proteinase